MFRRLIPVLIVLLLPAGLAAEDYPVNFPTDQKVTHASRRVSSVTLDGQTIAVRDEAKVYNPMLDRTFVVRRGQTLKPSMGYNGAWMNGYLYIDRGRDGQFDVKAPNTDGTLTADNDLVSYSYYHNSNSAGERLADGNHIDMPAFVLPDDMPTGYYRMRFKLDWDNLDPAGSLASGNELVTNGGVVVDVRLLVTDGSPARVSATGQGGAIVFHDGTELAGTPRPAGEALPLLAIPEEGHRLAALHVRHGIATDGDSLIHGVPQYLEESFKATDFNHGKFLLPASLVEGTVALEGIFEPLGEGETADSTAWVLTFADEFDGADGTRPDAAKWVCGPKGSSTWNRYVSDAPEVAYIADGHLVVRCIPAPERPSGSTDMLSGAVQSRGKYTFQYGRAEARLKTTKHRGNFPAFWMMPENTAGGWPTCGEIDIFETIDSQDRAWHTVHSNWTYTLGHTGNPASSANEWASVGEWHIYALEWDSEELRWYVDDQQVFTYRKSSSSNALADGQWPFDKAFYLILNQSVGNGSWAASHDPDYTYETQFDWVRVYQLRPTPFIPTGIESHSKEQDADYKAAPICDLTGRLVAGTHRGIYIKNRKKYVR